jgi:hypothetical protein
VFRRAAIVFLPLAALVSACGEPSKGPEPQARPPSTGARAEAEPAASLSKPEDSRGTTATDPEVFTATLQLRGDADAEGAAELVRADGERWPIAEEGVGPWHAFNGKSVSVRGVLAQESGKSSTFEVESLEADPESNADPFRVGARQQLSGKIEVTVGEVGSKLEGESRPTFVTSTGRFQLMNRPEWIRDGVSAKLQAREVERSPYSAHMGGRWLWIESATVNSASP